MNSTYLLLRRGGTRHNGCRSQSVTCGGPGGAGKPFVEFDYSKFCLNFQVLDFIRFT